MVMATEKLGTFQADGAIAKGGAFGAAGYDPDVLWRGCHQS